MKYSLIFILILLIAGCTSTSNEPWFVTNIISGENYSMDPESNYLIEVQSRSNVVKDGISGSYSSIYVISTECDSNEEGVAISKLFVDSKELEKSFSLAFERSIYKNSENDTLSNLEDLTSFYFGENLKKDTLFEDFGRLHLVKDNGMRKYLIPLDRRSLTSLINQEFCLFVELAAMGSIMKYSKMEIKSVDALKAAY